MEVNPYLITTGGLGGVTWEPSLIDSFVISQQIYIDSVLQTIIKKPVENFQESDFDKWMLCKQLYENIKIFVNNKTKRESHYVNNNYSIVLNKLVTYFEKSKKKYEILIQDLKQPENTFFSRATKITILETTKATILSYYELGKKLMLLTREDLDGVKFILAHVKNKIDNLNKKKTK